jgi:hypothetical protein
MTAQPNFQHRLTDSDPSVTDYILEAPTPCLQCGADQGKDAGGMEPRITPEQNDLPEIERARAESKSVSGITVIRQLAPRIGSRSVEGMMERLFNMRVRLQRCERVWILYIRRNFYAS